MDSGHMVFQEPWAEPVAAWVTTLRALGRPASSISTHLSHLRTLARDVADPWTTTVDDLYEHMAAHDWAPETRYSHRTTYRAFFGWGVRAGHIASSPAHELPSIRRPPPRPRALPERQLRAALATTDDRVRAMIRLGGEHGLRRAEIAVVHARDVIEAPTGYTLIVHGKGGKSRPVPIADDLAAWILARRRWAFPGNTADGHVSPWWVGRLISRQLDEGSTPHQLRHRFANAARRAGADLEVVRELLGHASLATTQAYVSAGDDELRAAVAAVRIS